MLDKANVWKPENQVVQRKYYAVIYAIITPVFEFPSHQNHHYSVRSCFICLFQCENMMLSDQEYLDLTEVGFFLGDLRAQLNYSKPSDKFAFTQKFFEQIRSGAHVVGMPYSYVMESNHNRRSFVLMLQDAFRGFPENMEVTSGDMFNIIESMSANFPKSLVMDASQSLHRNLDDDGTTMKHLFKSISHAVYCAILYDDWLRLVSDYFAEETSTNSMNLLKLKAKIEEFYVSISPTIHQPPLEISYFVLEASNPSSTGSGTSSYLVEVSLDQFRRTFFLSEAVKEEVQNITGQVK